MFKWITDDIPKHGLICESLFAGSHFMCTYFFNINIFRHVSPWLLASLSLWYPHNMLGALWRTIVYHWGWHRGRGTAGLGLPSDGNSIWEMMTVIACCGYCFFFQINIFILQIWLYLYTCYDMFCVYMYMCVCVYACVEPATIFSVQSYVILRSHHLSSHTKLICSRKYQIRTRLNALDLFMLRL